MTTKISGTTGIDRVEPTAAGLPFSFRNKIINGKMEIAQRGSSFPAATPGTFGVDRWVNGQSHNGAGTISQVADAPIGSGCTKSLRYTVTTADTAIATDQYMFLEQKLEGFNALDLVGRTFTVSFWVHSSVTGVHAVWFKNLGPSSTSDRSFVAEYSILAANTWEYKTVTVSGGLPTSGTWDFESGCGLRVGWSLACGSTFQTTPGAWQTGNYISSTNQVNCLASVGNIFAITGVQLEVGEVATTFEHRPIGLELSLCQRYYEAGYLGNLVVCCVADSWIVPQICFATAKRHLPTITTTRTGGVIGGTATPQAPVIGSGFRTVIAHTGAVGSQSFVDGYWNASAEL